MRMKRWFTKCKDYRTIPGGVLFIEEEDLECEEQEDGETKAIFWFGIGFIMAIMFVLTVLDLTTK